MRWVAVVPLNARPLRKSRLGPELTPEQRVGISELLFGHVVACVGRCPEIARAIILSPADPGVSGLEWCPDHGRGLNVELTRLRGELRERAMLVVHADLPFLCPDDLGALIGAAERAGCALAPDRYGKGTTAMALMPDVDFRFAFGPGSFSAHREVVPEAAIVARRGLAHDIDFTEDIVDAMAERAALPVVIADMFATLVPG